MTICRRLSPISRILAVAIGLAVAGLIARTSPAHEPPNAISPSPEDVSDFADSQSEAKVTFSARLEARNGGPSGQLAITAKLKDRWHLYSVTQPIGGPLRTEFQLVSEPSVRLSGAYRPDQRPTIHRYENLWPGVIVEEHVGTVTWRTNVTLPAGIDPATFKLQVNVVGQVCKSGGQCILNTSTFPVTLTGFAPGPIAGVASTAESPPKRDLETTSNVHSAADAASEVGASTTSAASRPPRQWKIRRFGSHLNLWSALGLALVGGFMLNFMPCVLPVIGLKIVAFIQQSQGSRRQAFLLNLFYSAGILAVFLVLASMAAVPTWFGMDEQFGWGQQFQSATFNLVMASLVFVFALSMLGVWEIPVPSFLGAGGNSGGAAKQGGYVGAFSKGVFTTLLATPCTGPFMGSALAWAFAQTPLVIFATFFTLGLGMSLPYLVIGAFPQLMRYLPKPGAWMDTFKQMMGFVLMGTVAFIFSFLPSDKIASTIGILIGLAVGCWWIGRTPIYAEWREKAKSWSAAIGMAGLIGWCSVALFESNSISLNWQPYSRTKLEQLIDGGQTVMVDFTARWCPNCIFNERYALNTEKTRELVESNSVAVVRADVSTPNETTNAINQLLAELGQEANCIPLLVIFPGDGSEPVAFSGLVSQSTVLKALKAAGPSKSDAANVALAESSERATH